MDNFIIVAVVEAASEEREVVKVRGLSGRVAVGEQRLRKELKEKLEAIRFISDDLYLLKIRPLKSLSPFLHLSLK